MAQRANSPTRGTTKLAAYETKIEAIRVLFRGCSSSGSSVCCHLQPRNTCARIPKGKESNIQVQFISWSITFFTRSKSKSLYIQNKIIPPSKSDKMIFIELDVRFFIIIQSVYKMYKTNLLKQFILFAYCLLLKCLCYAKIV